MLRRRKGSGNKESKNSVTQSDTELSKDQKSNGIVDKPNGCVDDLRLNTKKERRKSWTCADNCCWFVGWVCVLWWFMLFLFNAMPASFPQYVTEAITGPLPDPPGVKLAKEGLKAKHPVVFVPGIVTGGLELWEGHQCAEGLFRKRLWGGTFGELYKRCFFYFLHL